MMINNVAIFLPSSKIGGGNRVLIKLGKMLLEDKRKCTFYFIERKGKSFDLPIKYQKVSKPIFKDNILFILLSFVFLSLKIRQNKEIEYVIVSDPILCIFSFLYKNKKIIRYVQSDDLMVFIDNEKGNKFFFGIYKILFKISQRFNYFKVIFNSSFSLISYLKTVNNKFLYNNSHILNPPVFTTRFKKINKIKYSKNFKICSVVGNKPRKGLGNLINIIKNSNIKNIEFHIITQDKITFESPLIKYYTPKTDIEYVNILRKCNFFLGVSTFEGFGLPLIESMALGLVPISFYNKGLDEYNDNGLITIINSPEDFNKKLKKITQNINNLESLSKSAILIANKFDERYFYQSFKRKFT